MRLPFNLLLSVAVLAGCQGNTQESAQNLQNQVDSLETANEELTQQVRTLRDSLRVQEEGTVLSPPVYFPSGSAWIPDRGRRQLGEHAATIKEKYPDAGFRVQGYTDPVPIGPSLKDTYPSNWYLSARRAAAVAHYLDKNHGIRTEGSRSKRSAPERRRARTRRRSDAGRIGASRLWSRTGRRRLSYGLRVAGRKCCAEAGNGKTGRIRGRPSLLVN